MSDSYSNDPQQQGGQGDGGRDGYRGGEGGRGGDSRGGNRGGRPPGGREGGGFRIRLSDNEMRSARALQEAFNLRSTVAVLGFAVRTLGQMLEDGQLGELIEQQRSQAPRGGRREGGRGGDGRGEGGRGRRHDDDRQGGGGRGSRPDPFARPAKPAPPEPEAEAEPQPEGESDAAAEVDQSEQVDPTVSGEDSVAETSGTEASTSDDSKPAEA